MDTKTLNECIGAKAKMGELLDLKNSMNSQAGKTLGASDDIMEDIIKKLSDINVIDIQKMSMDELFDIITVNGKKLEITIDVKNEVEFLRDFLIYLKELEVTNKKIDIEIDNMDKVYGEYQEELNKILEENGCLFNVMRSQLSNMKNGTNTEYNIRMSKCFEDALTLEPLFDYLKEVKVKNILKDYQFNSVDIYKKYKRNTKKFMIKTDLVKLKNLGKYIKENPDTSDVFNNIVIFIAIRYYASKTNFDKIDDIGFITALSLAYHAIVTNTIDDKSLEKFTESHNRIVSMFI